MTTSLIMNRQYIDEQQVLTRYLHGQLSDAERDAFETYYVEHPQMLQELEIAAKLKLGLSLLEDSGDLTTPVSRYWLSGLAAAAAVLAVILTSFWFAKPAPVAPLMAASISALGEFAKLPSAADTFIIERTRSVGIDARVALPPTARPIALRVLPERPSAGIYGLRLNFISQGAASREVAHLKSLRPDAEGMITAYVNSTRLKPGNYEVLLSEGSAGTADTASSFLIAVEPPKH